MMNIPALIGVPLNLDELKDGMLTVVDGFRSEVLFEPTEEICEQTSQRIREEEEQQKLMQNLKGQENRTLDGKTVNIYANIGNVSDVGYVLENDAGGIGLFRSEFLYLGRDNFPTEALKFYCGYLNSGKAEDYLLQSLSSVLTSTVQDTENRLARMDFKIAVELSMLAHMIAYHSESRIDESVFRKLHAKCVEEVRRLNGAVELNDAYKYQKREN